MNASALLALSDKVTTELIDTIPALLWVAFAVFIVLFFRQQIRGLLPRVRSVKVGVFEAKLDAAIDAAAENRHLSLSGSQRSRVTRRALRDADTLLGAQVLWLDDDHTRTIAERAALEAVGVEVITASDEAQALKRLGEGTFDLLISDIKRGNNEQAGIAFASALREQHHGLPIVFYIGHVDPDKPLPRDAFGLTDRPDELMHLVMDVLARTRA